MKYALLLLFLGGWILSGHAQTAPDEVPGLLFWLRSDTLVTLNASGTVEAWEDANGSEQAATQGSSSIRPSFEEEVLNGHPAVRFDGPYDFLALPEQTEVYTIFLVATEFEGTDPNFRPLFGHSSLYDFHRGPDGYLWHPDNANAGILEGGTRLNFQNVDGTATGFPTTPTVFSLVSTQPLSIDQLSKDRTLFSRVWNGDWFEMLLYDTALTPEQVTGIEDYLAGRYSPKLATIDDVVTLNFCDTTVCVAEGFTSYLWNGEPGEACYTFSETQSVQVSVVDVFGREFSEEFEVIFPGEAPASATVCAGELYTASSGLDSDLFSILWTSDAETADATFGTAGTHGYTATDDQGCSITRTFELEVDAFGLQNVLPDTSSLCAGNFIAPDGIDLTGLNPQWNGESASPQLLVETSGWNYFTVPNALGCILEDSTYANVVGLAPEVHADVVAGCQNEPIQFSDASVADSPIVAWNWTLPDGTAYDASTFEAAVNDYGELPFSLLVQTEAGCTAQLDSTLLVKAEPQIDLPLPQVCSGEPFALSPQVFIPDGEVLQTFWNVGGTQLAQDIFLGNLEQSGDTPIEVTVISTSGCSATLETSLFIEPAPSVYGYVSSPRCEGQILEFNGTANCPDCTGDFVFVWDFGDGNFSSQEDPTHFYTEAGSYDYSLSVLGENGCLVEYENSLIIHEFPTNLSFTSDLLCSGVEVAFQNQTELGNTQFWEIPGATFTNWQGSSQPVVVFPSSGTYVLDLMVANAGCQTEQSFTLDVLPGPNTDFSLAAVLSPYTYQLVPEEMGGTHLWTIDTQDPLETTSPVVDFASDQPVSVHHWLQAENGCAADQTLEITPDSIVSNLVAEAVFAFEDGLGNRVIDVQIFNESTHGIGEVALRLGTDGDAGLEEIHNLNLPAGEGTVVRLNQLIPSAYQGLICVEVRWLSTTLTETTLDDNRACNTAAGNTSELSFPYPNPASDVLHLDVVLDQSASDVNVLLLDQIGREVRAWQGPLETGFHRLELSVQGLSDGMYTLVVRRFDEIWKTYPVLIAQPGE